MTPLTLCLTQNSASNLKSELLDTNKLPCKKSPFQEENSQLSKIQPLNKKENYASS